MHDDDLKALWRAQSIEPAPPLPDASQMAEMKSRMRCLNRTLFLRDCRENIAAVIVMVVFGYYFFNARIAPTLLARAGCVIVILSSLLVTAYPVWRKRRVAKAPAEASMMQSLESELGKLEVEIAILRSVLWWYILPGTVGVMVFFAGLTIPTDWKILFALPVFALDAFVYWLNQRAVEKCLLPGTPGTFHPQGMLTPEVRFSLK